ncbi:MAG TPA: cytochrome c [Gaiellaceae bacterium]|jgi:mono/diheme cytochrome c family protein
MRRAVPFAIALAALVAVGVVLAAAGCGGNGGSSESKDAAGAGSPGEKIFASAGCAGCHTMEAAGATGKVGPNLDELRPNQETVTRQVRNGGNGMPSFKDKLSATEIQQVAAFVSTAAGTGRAGKISFEPNDQKVDDCQDTTCFEQAFGNMAYDDGPKAALEKLASLSSSNGTVAGDCHPIAHKIGAGGLLHFKGDVGKAFADGDATCGSGYYHGLLQWKLAGVAADQVAAVASTACKDPTIEANAFIYYQCNHGLGHGLMLYTGLDLPKALDYCHKLQTESDSIMCSGGVFMENQSSSFGLHSKWLSKKNLLFPCNSKYVQREDKLYCYLLVTSHILPYVHGSWKKTSDWCRKSDPGWVQYCFQSMGRDVSGVALRDPQQMKSFCSEAGSGEKECIYGAVRDVMNNNAQDPKGGQFCTVVAAKFRDYCFYGMGTILGTQHADAEGKRSACEQFAKGEDLNQCLSGAGV